MNILLCFVFIEALLVLCCQGLNCGKRWSAFGETICYRFFQGKDWFDARLDCMNHGGQLATIENEDQNEFIVNAAIKYMRVNGLREFNWWLGLEDFSKEGEFRWHESNTTVDRSLRHLWRQGEPDSGGAFSPADEDCAALFVADPHQLDFEFLKAIHGKWADLPCESASTDVGYVCEKYLVPGLEGIFLGDTYVELKIDEDASYEGFANLIHDAVEERKTRREYWSGGAVPTKISKRFRSGHKFRIRTALQVLEKQFCNVTFPPYTGKEENFIHIVPHPRSSLCASEFVGMKGGEQKVILGSSCVATMGIIYHEILHSIGIPHEHQRPDRDNYISIVSQNIIPTALSQFDKLNENEKAWENVNYDFDSVMHYEQHAFSIRPKFSTIVPLDKSVKGDTLGQRVKLSDSDLQKVANIYPCESQACLPPAPPVTLTVTKISNLAAATKTVVIENSPTTVRLTETQTKTITSTRSFAQGLTETKFVTVTQASAGDATHRCGECEGPGDPCDGIYSGKRCRNVEPNCLVCVHVENYRVLAEQAGPALENEAFVASKITQVAAGKGRKAEEPLADAPCSGSYEYPENCRSSDSFEKCTYYASWTYNSARRALNFEIYQSNHNAWTGIGFSRNKLMAGSDIVVGFMQNDKPKINDYFTYERNPVLDFSQDVEAQSGDTINSGYVIKFQKKIRTGDYADFDLSAVTCFHLLFPVRGGPVSRGAVTYHYKTPVVSPTRYCFNKC